jgi:hypothetical protein
MHLRVLKLTALTVLKLTALTVLKLTALTVLTHLAHSLAPNGARYVRNNSLAVFKILTILFPVMLLT